MSLTSTPFIEVAVSSIFYTFIFTIANMSKQDVMQSMIADSKHQKRASDRIPIIARDAVSDRAKKTLDLVSRKSLVEIN